MMNTQFERNSNIEKNDGSEQISEALYSEAVELFERHAHRQERPSAAMDYFPSAEEVIGKTARETEFVPMLVDTSSKSLVEEVIGEYLRAEKMPHHEATLRQGRDAAEDLAKAIVSGNLSEFKRVWQQIAKYLTDEQIQDMVQKINDSARRLHLDIQIDVNEKGDLYIFNPSGENLDALKVSANGAVDIVRVVRPAKEAPYFESVDKIGENVPGEKAREYREITFRAIGTINATGRASGGGSAATPESFTPARPLPPPPHQDNIRENIKEYDKSLVERMFDVGEPLTAQQLAQLLQRLNSLSKSYSPTKYKH